MRWLHCTLFLALAGGVLIVSAGCETTPEYSRERPRQLAATRPQVWAVAPVINLSGERGVDPILQADLVFQQLQQVRGLTVLPVNKAAEVYIALRIERIASAEQAALVCDLLHCDALVVPAVTIFDPYNPPKFGAAMQLFIKPAGYTRPAGVDPRELIGRTTPRSGDPITVANVVQAVGMFDAANGSVRDRLALYARGRHDPVGPLGMKEYLVHMDRYCSFVYSELIDEMIMSPKLVASAARR